MGIGHPPTQFKPGNPGGPGREKLPEVVKSAQRFNRQEFIQIAEKYMNMPLDDLVAASKDKTLLVKEMVIVSVMARAITKGDHKRYDFLLDRIIGRSPKHHVLHPGAPVGLPQRQKLDYSKLSLEEAKTLEYLLKKALVDTAQTPTETKQINGPDRNEGEPST